jgi:hypothetical protein
MRIRRWVVAVGAAAAVVALGAGAVVAQSGEDGSSFLDRVAEKLGIEPERLEQAIRDTRNEDIDAAVERGDLSREQADRLKAKLDELGPGSFGGPPFPGGRFHDGFPGGPGFGFKFGLPGSMEDLADFLGLDFEQLREELSGEDATLATVAEAHGKSRDELKSFIRDSAAQTVADAVADGTITQQRADDILARLNESLDPIIDSPCGPRGFHFRFELKHGDGPGESPHTPAPQGGSGSGSGIREN